jgi:hypothetical protein
LVAELGIILFLLMGWQFMVGEWIGGVVLVVILSWLVRLTRDQEQVPCKTRNVPQSAILIRQKTLTCPTIKGWSRISGNVI